MLPIQKPIGVFDSGVGGLSVLQALRIQLPHERFVYCGDSSNAPYGERGDVFVTARTHAIARYLREEHQIKALVVACNTATAAAIHELRRAQPELPMIGVEPAIKPAAELSRTRRIGVIGTRGTLTSAKFGTLLAEMAQHAQFVVQPCDGLAHAIERSTLHMQQAPSEEVQILCERYLAAMGVFGTSAGQIDTLVLGCTHYVFAANVLRVLVGPQVQIIETGAPVARQTQRLLGMYQLLAPLSDAPLACAHLLTTGDLASLQAAAQCWLDLPIDCCDTVSIT